MSNSLTHCILVHKFSPQNSIVEHTGGNATIWYVESYVCNNYFLYRFYNHMCECIYTHCHLKDYCQYHAITTPSISKEIAIHYLLWFPMNSTNIMTNMVCLRPPQMIPCYTSFTAVVAYYRTQIGFCEECQRNGRHTYDTFHNVCRVILCFVLLF